MLLLSRLQNSKATFLLLKWFQGYFYFDKEAQKNYCACETVMF